MDFILHQMRLVLSQSDFVRLYIISQKINLSVFSDPTFSAQKDLYYKLMSSYYRNERNTLELAKCLYQIGLDKSGSSWSDVRSGCVMFLCMSVEDSESLSMMHKLLKEESMENMSSLNSLLKLFTTKEIMKYPLPNQEELMEHPEIQEGGLRECWNDLLKKRVTEHNLLVVSSYYTRVTGKRVQELLNISAEDMEMSVSELVTCGRIYAKINRPNDTYRFERPKKNEEILDDWVRDIETLMNTVEKTTHKIQKELTA